MEWTLFKDEWGYINENGQFIACGSYQVNQTLVTITDSKDEVVCTFDFDSEEIECDHPDPKFEDDETQGYCEICGCHCNWTWGKDTDEEAGEIQVREIDWLDEIQRTSILGLICKEISVDKEIRIMEKEND